MKLVTISATESQRRIPVLAVMTIALCLGTVVPSQARLSEPDVVYSGTAINGASGNVVSIRLNGSTTSLASCTLGSDRKYVLRVPMDAFEPRMTGTAISGDGAIICLDGTQVANGAVTIPSRGTLVRLDLGSRTKEQWDKDHPGDDGSGDMNRNGITDLAEYLAGGDPAGCIWTTVDDSHAETTVYHEKVLANCLADAGGDGKHNLIRVARGSYVGNFSYTAGWNENYDLTLIGGYDPAGSGERQADPTLTVLNGDPDGDGAGNGIVLALDSDTSKSIGRIHVESFMLRNGMASGVNGGGIQARVYQGGLGLVGNSISGNSAASGGGVSIESSGSGQIFLTDNSVYGNSATTAGAVRIVSRAAGPVILLNNTLADNSATSDGDGRSLQIETTTAAVELTNNIIYGSSPVTGAESYLNSSGVAIALSITHNAFAGSGGLYANVPAFVCDASNIDGDPRFVAPLTGNYRLSSTSPLVDKGVVHAMLPPKDAGGAGRISGGIVDLGAFEYHDPAKPYINAFTALPRANYLIADTSINASDDIAVTGYCVTESDSSGSCNWAATAPASYIFATAGAKTLYAFVRDASGNISDPCGATLTVSIPALTVSVAGAGSGSVASVPSGISCAAGICGNSFSGTVDLYANPSAQSVFGGWSGACSGTSSPCSITMNENRSVTATFILAPLLLINGIPYATLQAAYDAAASGAVIQLLDNSVAGTLSANRGISVTVRGGYDSGYAAASGSTVVTAPLTVGQGQVLADRLVIR